MDKRELKYLGEDIISELDSIDSDLKSARNLGIWDIFGGGAGVGFFKHRSMGKAQKKLDKLARDLRKFQEGVNSSSIPMEKRIDTGAFNKYMDIFVDNQLANFYTQAKIGDGRKNIREMKRSIEDIVDML